jgi:two-component system, NarL family, invasion response regulator UvrY
MMIHIIIADDHYLIREGFSRLASKQKDICVVAAVATARELFDCIKKNEIDVVVLDISLPDRNGLDVLKDLHLQAPDISVLILSMHSEEHFAIRALQYGASGYISKTAPPEELIRAVRKVSGGGHYVSEALGEKLATVLGPNQEKSSHDVLSDREFQVLLLIAQGKASKEIADSLAISDNTVRTYRRRIMEKLGLKSITEMIRYVFQHNLLD